MKRKFKLMILQDILKKFNLPTSRAMNQMLKNQILKLKKIYLSTIYLLLLILMQGHINESVILRIKINFMNKCEFFKKIQLPK
jgi:hypothetical protein